MLGAVKGDPDGDEVPLFRLLARRWKSLAPLRRERTSFLAKPLKQEPKPARSWIEKPRNAIYAHQRIDRPNAQRTWNPWLWIK